MDNMLTIAEAAAELGLEESHVRRLCRREKLKAHKRGHDWFVDRQSVKEYRELARRPGPIPFELRKREGVESIKSQMDGRELEFPVTNMWLDAETVEAVRKTLEDVVRDIDPRVEFVIAVPPEIADADKVKEIANRLGIKIVKKMAHGGA